MKKIVLSRMLVATISLFICIGLTYAGESRVSFQTNDGTTLSGILTTADQPQALMLVVHGLQSHAEWFLSRGYLAEHGITTLAFDRRGSGYSGGVRGHANSSEELLDDLASAYKELKKYGPDLPIHLHLNCFATRIGFPFISANPSQFSSMIVTAPSTHMSPNAEYSESDKSTIRWNIFWGKDKKYFHTPLSDELFVTNLEGLEWIKNDQLSLRRVTFGFLRTAKTLSDEMKRVIPSLKLPMLLILGEKDLIVLNDKIETEFYSNYAGEKQLLKLDSEHALELGGDVQRYREAMTSWVFSRQR
ncbi:MAG: alpha/beta hydrolase [Deltaproteobacteria bacterium]|nr:alpha/beta hydrolase [Deltaproteobacteria bacterium]